MFFVYILRSLKSNRLYVGQTKNIKKRIKYHNEGLNASTKHYRPWELIFTESFSSRTDAIRLEKKIKSWKNPQYVLSWIENKKAKD